MGMYEVPLSMSLLGFGMGTMLANFHVCGIMLVLRAVFNMLVRNASPRAPMCLGAWCLICQDRVSCYFLLCFIASWTWVVVSVMVCPCIFLCCSVNVSVCCVLEGQLLVDLCPKVYSHVVHPGSTPSQDPSENTHWGLTATADPMPKDNTSLCRHLPIIPQAQQLCSRENI